VKIVSRTESTSPVMKRHQVHPVHAFVRDAQRRKEGGEEIVRLDEALADPLARVRLAGETHQAVVA
jgi:hypothetical protein